MLCYDFLPRDSNIGCLGVGLLYCGPTLLNVTLSPHSSWTCVSVIEAANGPQLSMDGPHKTYLVKKSRFLVYCDEVW